MACFSSAPPFHSVCEPPDIVKRAFKEFSFGKDLMTPSGMASFMRDFQGDPSVTVEQAREEMKNFISYSWDKSSSRSLKALGFRTGSQSSRSSKWGLLHREPEERENGEEGTVVFTLRAFLKFLLNTRFNGHRTPVSKTPTEDMTAPLSDYFIYASHNTYLTGNQLTSESSTYPIAKALSSGCRVIELDCWSGLDGKINVLDCLNSPHQKISVLHGRTFTKAVTFEACIKAIKDSAFLKSDYPVILTIENHLAPAYQKHAAEVLREILGDMMFIPSPNDRPPKSFQSPESLKNKIIISDKPPGDSVLSQVAEDPEFAEKVFKESIWKRAPKGVRKILGNMMRIRSAKDRPPKPFQANKLPPDSYLNQVVQHPALAEKALKNSFKDYRSDSSDLEEGSHSRREKVIHRRQHQVVDELRVLRKSKSLSPDAVPTDPEFEELLYIHCQKPSEMKPKHEKGRPLTAGENAIMANLSESQLDDFIEHHPNSLIKFSQTNLGRVYPFGLRFNSSNADPLDAWRHGMQVAAINMQGRDRPVWISRAFFSKNGGCGYVKKPAILLPGSNFRYLKSSNPEFMTELEPKLELKVTILLGTDWHKNYDVLKKPDYFVKIGVHGMYGDEVKQKTRVENRSREPHWEDQEFTFSIRVPELAILRLEVKEHDFCRDDMVGQSCVPVTELRQGIRAVELQSSRGLPRKSKLLCHFAMRSL